MNILSFGTVVKWSTSQWGNRRALHCLNKSAIFPNMKELYKYKISSSQKQIQKPEIRNRKTMTYRRNEWSRRGYRRSERKQQRRERKQQDNGLMLPYALYYVNFFKEKKHWINIIIHHHIHLNHTSTWFNIQYSVFSIQYSILNIQYSAFNIQ
jgi:hypothetical protein